VGGENIENLYPESIIEYLKNGIEVDIPYTRDKRNDYFIELLVKDIPKEVETIIIQII
jgi:hypothetical protein